MSGITPLEALILAIVKTYTETTGEASVDLVPPTFRRDGRWFAHLRLGFESDNGRGDGLSYSLAVGVGSSLDEALRSLAGLRGVPLPPTEPNRVPCVSCEGYGTLTAGMSCPTCHGAGHT